MLYPNNRTLELKTKNGMRRVIAMLLALVIVLSGGFFFLGENGMDEPDKDDLLSFFRPVTASATDAVAHYVRVGLYYGSSAKTSVTISCNNGFYVGTGASDGFRKAYELTSIPTITFTASNGVITGTDANGTVVIDAMGQNNCIWPAAGGRVTVTAGSSSRTYRGGVIMIPWQNVITVINLVGLEEYLYGVVNAEMYHSNPMEALKAQAVSARSFVASQLNKHKSSGFDVCTTTHCQVYRGVAGEADETTIAVDETKGQCIRYNGEISVAYYSSNNGGWIMDIKDVWGGTCPYTVAKQDPYTPVAAWSAALTYEELADRLDIAGKGVGAVTSVDVTKTTEYGYVTELTITGTEGTTVLKNSQIVTGFASSLIKSQNFVLIDTTKIAPLATLSEAEETADGANGPIVGTVEGNVTVLNADGTATEVATTELTVQGDSLAVQIPTTADETGVKQILFYGSGDGHSLGMSQDGAKAMANLGFTYDEILKFYFTGIEVY